MQICYVVNSVSDTSVPATIATALTRYEGITVDILAWFDHESFEGEEVIDVTCLEAPNTPIGVDRRTYAEARKFLDGYDLIQAHTNHSGSIAKIIGYRLGIPIVSREGNTRNGFTRMGRISNGLTNGLVDRIVPNSRAVYDSFTKWERLLIDPKDVKIIPNGVDLDQIDRLRGDDGLHDLEATPDDSVMVSTASVLSKQKSLDTLIEGIQLANNRSSRRIDLVVAGDGPQRRELKTLANSLNIDDQIQFLGMRDRSEVYRILNLSDIYAMPSQWEGFSQAAVEALGAKNACVFTKIDPFWLPYQDVALFHEVNNADKLADRLVTLADNPEIRASYAKRGRNLVEEKYTLSAVAERYSSLYNGLV